MPKQISLADWEEGMYQLEKIERYLDKNWLDEDFPMTKVWDLLIDKPLGDSKQEVGCDAHSV